MKQLRWTLGSDAGVWLVRFFGAGIFYFFLLPYLLYIVIGDIKGTFLEYVLSVIMLVGFFSTLRYFYKAPVKKWMTWDTLEEYWAAHQECKTDKGTKCYKCNSAHINNVGWEAKADWKRIHVCNQCNTFLYRSEQ